MLPSLAQGTPDMPQCGFSRMACVVLHAYGESGSAPYEMLGMLLALWHPVATLSSCRRLLSTGISILQA